MKEEAPSLLKVHMQKNIWAYISPRAHVLLLKTKQQGRRSVRELHGCVFVYLPIYFFVCRAVGIKLIQRFTQSSTWSCISLHACISLYFVKSVQSECNQRVAQLDRYTGVYCLCTIPKQQLSCFHNSIRFQLAQMSKHN